MIKFELEERQKERVQKWLKHHWETIHKGFQPRDLTGATVKFSFTPTGFGDNGEAECIWCSSKAPERSVNFSIGDDNEFVCDYDENWKDISSWREKEKK